MNLPLHTSQHVFLKTVYDVSCTGHALIGRINLFSGVIYASIHADVKDA